MCIMARIHMSDRVNFSQCLLFSRGLFQASAWPRLQDAEHKNISTAIMKVHRSMCSQDFQQPKQDWLNDDAVMEKTGAMAPFVCSFDCV